MDRDGALRYKKEFFRVIYLILEGELWATFSFLVELERLTCTLS